MFSQNHFFDISVLQFFVKINTKINTFLLKSMRYRTILWKKNIEKTLYESIVLLEVRKYIICLIVRWIDRDDKHFTVLNPLKRYLAGGSLLETYFFQDFRCTPPPFP